MTDTWALLQRRLQRQPGDPLVTWAELTHGDRVELSTASLLNAAIKIANALRGEFDLAVGSPIAVDLPVHWQRSAWCAGAWIAGCAIDTRAPSSSGALELVVTSSQRASGQGAAFHGAAGCPVGVVSLHPLGLPDREALPSGAVELTGLVRQQPDQYLFDAARDDTPAYVTDTESLSQHQVYDLAHVLAASWGLEPGGRLLADDATSSDHLWAAVLAVPLACEASVVLASGTGDLDALSRQEAVTARAS